MKNKSLNLLLCAILIAVILMGCGSEDQNTKVASMTEAESEIPKPEEPDFKISAIESPASEVSAAGSLDSEYSDPEETANAESSSEDELCIPKEDYPKEIEAEEAKNAEDFADVPESSIGNDVEVQEIQEYTLVEISAIMYAVSAVNVRDMPSVDGQRIGGLEGAQEVAVTGQCNETSWYQVDYHGQTGYVSNRYLSSEPPVMTVPEIDALGLASDPSGLVSIDNLENKKSLKKSCTDEEFQAAYDAAAQIVTSLEGLSREEQLAGIASALRYLVDSGQVAYSTEAAHYNDPYGYFVLGVSSCAGCARATGLCLNMLGISYEHVNENQWSHQWCRINIDGTYWICDAYGLYVGPEPEPYTHPFL